MHNKMLQCNFKIKKINETLIIYEENEYYKAKIKDMLHLMCKHNYKCVFFQCTYLYYNSCLVQLQNSSINLNTKCDDIVYTTECARPAKRSKIQGGGGVQRCSQI